MIDAKDPEFVRLLARLKLNVRRHLGHSIDLSRLQADAQQLLDALAEIENLAEEEELMTLVLQVRALVIQKSSRTVADNPPDPPLAEQASAKNSFLVHSYRFGARGG
ncbi:hypothetical protein [Tepidiphilus olei]|uniref:hypothetical protein n=1 Tax=Tepidiphilus olei TaxID=2502184 RepID=UPI00115D3648|nr:hypothetical protein [Tepidiphilus olei]